MDNKEKMSELIAAKKLLPLEAVEPVTFVRFRVDSGGNVRLTIPCGLMPNEVASELEGHGYSDLDDALSDVGVGVADYDGLKRKIRQSVRKVMAEAGISWLRTPEKAEE